MSPEDLDIVSRAYDAFARGDLDALVDLVLWQVVTVEDGQLTRMHDFATREEALAAAAQPDAGG